MLLRAAQQVRRAVPEVLFVLVGDGWGPAGVAYMAEMKALAHELGVDDVVRFVGGRSDIPDTLMAFDVSVQCSLNENLGGSIESLLMERPLVASDVGGLPDAVQHERTGLLVPPGDADALAAAITRLLLDRPFARTLAAQGRAFALERLTLSRTVAELGALYQRELASAAARGRSERRGYRLWRSLWRAVRSGPWVRRHVLRRLSQATRPVAPPPMPAAPPPSPISPRPVSPAPSAALPERAVPVPPAPLAPMQIIQMASCHENAEWFAQIAARLQRPGRMVSTIIGLPEAGLAARLRELRVTVVSTRLAYAGESGPARLPLYLLRAVASMLRLARSFRRQRVTVVHTHVFSTIIIGRVAAWLARVPCRVSMVPGPLHLEAPGTRWLDRLTAWMDHRVVAGSRATYDRYLAMGLSAPHLQCIPYGVDAARFDPAAADGTALRREFNIAPDAPLVGLVAYFYPPRSDWQTPAHLRGRGLKGHEDFIAAARLVRQRRPNARFLLVGRGISDAGEAYRHELMARVDRSDLRDALIFAGHRDDVPNVLAAVQVAVQCSLSENYGGTIESLLMETPTVATRVGGMPETVRHLETGLVVPPAAPQALADAILWMLEHRDEAKQMARAGRALMLSAYTIEHTVDGIDALYDEVLTGRSAASGHPVIGGAA